MNQNNFLFFLAVLACLPFSAQNFHMIWQSSEPLPYTYLDSNVNAVPAISAPQTACTNAPVSVSLDATSVWNENYFSSGTASGATDISQLLPPPTASSNYNLRWINQSQSNQLYNYVNPIYLSPRYFVWSPSDQWGPFLNSIGIYNYASYEYPTRTKYKDYQTSTWYGGGQPYKAYTGLLCHSKANIKWATGQYSADYLGSPIYQTITFSSPGTYYINGNLSIQRCMAPIRNDGTYTTKDLYVVADTAFQPAFQAAQKSIVVSNPFICSLAASSFAPTTMPASNVTTFSFKITNNGNMPVTVKNITLMPSSAFSNLKIINPTLPTSTPIIPNGYVIFTGNVTAPSSQGTYTLSLNISTSSTAADCSGSIKNCGLVANFSITVTAIPFDPVSCTLAFQNHGSTFTAPDSANAVATCRASNNAVVNCGYLAWSTTATAGTVSPTVTNTPPNQSQTNLSFSAVSSYQNNAMVKAAKGSYFSCNLSLNVTGPDYRPILTANATQVQVNKQFTANVTTQNIGAAANITTVTRLRFRTTVQPFSVAPLGQQGTQNNSYAFSCPNQAGTYELNATADDTGLLNESDEGNNFVSMTINCTEAPPVLKPDYVSNVVAPISATYGSTFNIQMVTANTGPAAATVPSTTQLNITGYPPMYFNVPALAAGGYVTNSTTATCPNYTTTLTLKSFADLYNQTGESNRSNNNDTTTVNCVPPSGLPNYVPNITAPSVAFVGYQFSASFGTKNIGTANAASNSTTRATFQGQSTDFLVSPLPAGAQQIDNIWGLSCTSTDTKSIAEYVNLYNTVTESNYLDNTQLWPITCYNAPDSCNLSFSGNTPPFGTYENALVTATCYNGNVQTACPPFSWAQTANNSSMVPSFTNASLSPNSTLVIFNADTPQIGRKVTASSSLNMLDLSCELPFDISDQPVGPDYTILSIVASAIPASLGQTIHFTVKVKNIGNVDAVNSSKTDATFSSGCTPVKTSYNFPHLNVNQVDTNSELACTCVSPGWHSILAEANKLQTQFETTYLNNNKTYSFYCQPNAQIPVCSQFV